MSIIMLALMQYGIQMGVINTSPMVFPFTGAWTASSGPINQLPRQCGPFRDAENKIMAAIYAFFVAKRIPKNMWGHHEKINKKNDKSEQNRSKKSIMLVVLRFCNGGSLLHAPE